MKVLLVHKHFWPDTPPYAVMLKAIAERLDKDGHDVTVLSTQPSYKSNTAKQKKSEQFGQKGTIKRFSLLNIFNSKLGNLLNFVYFPLRVFLYLVLNRKYDAVTISTAPPVLGGFFTALAARITNTKFIYHCMDIHPEIGLLSGEFSNKYIYKALVKMDSKACELADKVIVLSSDMKTSLYQRDYLSKDKVSINIINNFALPSDKLITKDKVHSKFLKSKQDIFRIIFAGNLGRFQGLEDIVEATNLLGPLANFELVFLGEGKALSSLQSLAEKSPEGMIKFFPQVSVTEAKELINDADLGIVSLQSEIIKYAYPSKTMTYLEQGCPLFVVVEAGTELSNFVDAKEIGLIAQNGDIESIKNALKSAYENKSKLALKKEDIKIVYNESFSQDIQLNVWSKLFKDLAK